MKEIIVTRHKGLVAWLNAKGIYGDVIEHVDDEEQIRDRIVYGVLPLHLASKAKMLITVNMEYMPADKRGVDLSPTEMDEYGASMVAYVVQQVVMEVDNGGK